MAVKISDAEAVKLAKATFYQGPMVLIDRGMTPKEIDAFVQRPEVVGTWGLLQREYDMHGDLEARAKFYAKRGLHKLVEQAHGVLEKSVEGPEYMRDKQGRIQTDAWGNWIVKEPEPTAKQLKAARMILHDGAGLRDYRIIGSPGSDANLKMLFAAREEARVVEVEPGENEEERAFSREKVRNAIEVLARSLPAAMERVEKELGSKKPRRKAKKKAKARARKKASQTA